MDGWMDGWILDQLCMYSLAEILYIQSDEELNRLFYWLIAWLMFVLSQSSKQGDNSCFIEQQKWFFLKIIFSIIFFLSFTVKIIYSFFLCLGFWGL